MRCRSYFCLLFFLLFINLVYADEQITLKVLMPPFVKRGEVLKVVILPSGPVNDILLEIIKNNSTVLSARAFPIGTIRNKNIWIGLLGIPSYTKKGMYNIRITGKGSTKNFVYKTNIDILTVTYIHEKIALNASLSKLRSGKDPAVRKQTEELVKLLNTFNPGSIFDRGVFHKPVNGIVSAHFGDRREYRYYDGEVVKNIHNGIDFAVPVGTDVHACADGLVVFAGKRIITGNSVIIEHLPGVYSLYYHLSVINVKKGQMVRRDGIIGKSGESGLATGPHLHWEVIVSGAAVDPEELCKNKIIDKTNILSIIEKQ